MISKETIQSSYIDVLEEVNNIIPIDKWHVQPCGIDITTHKSKFGYARNDGMIFISKYFIGTNSSAKLSDTLKHEFAHLAVGLAQHHNFRFKRVASLFGVGAECLKHEINDIVKNINYKYTIYAHMVNGQVKEIGGASRKTKKYAQYRLTNKSSMSINSIKVTHFVFKQNW